MAGTPPPFNPYPEAPAAKKGISPWVWITGLVLLLCILFGVGCTLMMRNVGSQVSQTAKCAITFEFVSKSILAYAAENDNTFPPAENWQQTIAPYYDRLYNKAFSDEEMKDAPGFMKGFISGFMPPKSTEPMQCVTGSTITVVTYNADIAGKKFNDIPDRSSTVLLFEQKGSGLSTTAPYQKQSDTDAPKIMNEKRDWFIIYADGDGNASGSSSEMDFKVTIDDAKGAPEEPASNAQSNSP
ncbi:MAG: hypothetical protein KF812_10830 [Fimbriimonadaceae bacterium]|nr:hypothetical protein [Fimbriimonadaceae bacterium]